MENKQSNSENCPYCMSPIEPGQEVVTCTQCGNRHHANCWKENGKCGAYGCDGVQMWPESIARKIAPRVDGMPDLSDIDKIPDGAVRNDTAAGTSRRGATRPAVSMAPCTECGKSIPSDQLMCHECRMRQRRPVMENCFGPAVVMLGVFVGIVTLLVRAFV